jgi:hypothetical protein
MNDDVEDRLRKYRPSGPPPAFRGRVVGAARGASRAAGRRLLEWLPAAAAAAAAIVFYTLGAGAHREVAAHLQRADADRTAAVAGLADALGGSDYARDEATRVIDDGGRDAVDNGSVPSADPFEAQVSHHE